MTTLRLFWSDAFGGWVCDDGERQKWIVGATQKDAWEKWHELYATVQVPWIDAPMRNDLH